DLAKLLMFFAFANGIFNVSIIFNSPALPVIYAVFISFVLMFLSVLRYKKLEVRSILIIFGLAIAIGLVTTGLVFYTVLNPLQLSFIALLAYYFTTATLNHIVHRDLTPNIVAE